jgi:hypothetical protein
MMYYKQLLSLSSRPPQFWVATAPPPGLLSFD